MVDLATIVLGAFAGVAGGVATTAINERLKRGRAAFEAELTRLDGLRDELVYLLDAGGDDSERRMLARRLITTRRRLGINLRRCISDGGRYSQACLHLVVLDQLIGAVEDGKPPRDIEGAVDAAVEPLRRLIQRSASAARALAVFKG